MKFHTSVAFMQVLCSGSVGSLALAPSASRMGIQARQSGWSQQQGRFVSSSYEPVVPVTRLSAITVDEIAGAVVTEDVEDSQDEVKSYLDDGFVFGLENSGLERPKGKTASLVVENDSLETTPYQVGIVASTMLTHGYILANQISQVTSQSHDGGGSEALCLAFLAVSSWVLADLGSGIFHWSVDNYGNGRTPLLGSTIAAFQGHHSAPWTITQRGFCNNLYKLCLPFAIPSIAVNFLAGPYTTFFFGLFFVMVTLSQEFHKYSHMTKGEVPDWINKLQDYGLIIGRTQHALHHKAPYDGNYCIVSGVCNPFLDSTGFFRRLEHMIYKWNGVESNAWKLDEELRSRTLEGKYEIE